MTEDEIEYTYKIQQRPGQPIDSPKYGVVVDIFTNDQGESEIRISSNMLNVADTERALGTAMEMMDDFWRNDEQAVPEERDENLAAHLWRPWPEETDDQPGQ